MTSLAEVSLNTEEALRRVAIGEGDLSWALRLNFNDLLLVGVVLGLVGVVSPSLMLEGAGEMGSKSERVTRVDVGGGVSMVMEVAAASIAETSSVESSLIKISSTGAFEADWATLGDLGSRVKLDSGVETIANVLLG